MEERNLNNVAQNDEFIAKGNYSKFGLLLCIGPLLSAIAPLIQDDGTFRLVAYILLDLGHVFVGLVVFPLLNFFGNSDLRLFIADR